MQFPPHYPSYYSCINNAMSIFPSLSLSIHQTSILTSVATPPYLSEIVLMLQTSDLAISKPRDAKSCFILLSIYPSSGLMQLELFHVTYLISQNLELNFLAGFSFFLSFFLYLFKILLFIKNFTFKMNSLVHLFGDFSNEGIKKKLHR